MNILIISENASLKYGGEAALPLHYFRVLRKKKINVWMIVHGRRKEELRTLFPDDLDKIFYIEDNILYKFLFSFNKFLPAKIYYFTFGSLSRTITQINQVKLAKYLIEKYQIDIIHQPIPVSPKLPSMIYNMGVPVVIGPMNGGMNYPQAFQVRETIGVNFLEKSARYLANIMNILIPGKRKAAVLLVANQRTKNALPKPVKNSSSQIMELVENGIDLSIWNTSPIDNNEDKPNYDDNEDKCLKIIYIGRLVDWKGVDLLITAFANLVTTLPEYTICLDIIGDGKQRSNLEQQAKSLGLEQNKDTNNSHIVFRGQLPQQECAKHLEQAQIMVLPSLYECGGAVVLEAMAMKVPVIATNWGGPADYLDDSCGILVDPDNKESFIENLSIAMKKLVTNPDLVKLMGERGYQKAVSLYDWDEKANKILEIYQKCI